MILLTSVVKLGFGLCFAVEANTIVVRGWSCGGSDLDCYRLSSFAFSAW